MARKLKVSTMSHKHGRLSRTHAQQHTAQHHFCVYPWNGCRRHIAYEKAIRVLKKDDEPLCPTITRTGASRYTSSSHFCRCAKCTHPAPAPTHNSKVFFPRARTPHLAPQRVCTLKMVEGSLHTEQHFRNRKSNLD